MLRTCITLFLSVFVLSLQSGCKPPEAELSGDVFIVTKGGQNIKLGLVEVSVFPADSIKPFIEAKLELAKGEIERLKPIKEQAEKEYERAKQEMDNRYSQYLRHILSDTYENRYKDAKAIADKKRERYRAALDELLSYSEGHFYLSGLPSPLLVAKTDADGKFSMKLRPARYALAAFSTRRVGDETEKYYWLVWITVQSDHPNRVMLSNDNLFDTSCSDCIVKRDELPY